MADLTAPKRPPSLRRHAGPERRVWAHHRGTSLARAGVDTVDSEAVIDAEQAVRPLLARREQFLDKRSGDDLRSVDRVGSAFGHQHRGTVRQHVPDPIGARPVGQAHQEPVVGGERDDWCLVRAARDAAAMPDQ